MMQERTAVLNDVAIGINNQSTFVKDADQVALRSLLMSISFQANANGAKRFYR